MKSLDPRLALILMLNTLLFWVVVLVWAINGAMLNQAYMRNLDAVLQEQGRMLPVLLEAAKTSPEFGRGIADATLETMFGNSIAVVYENQTLYWERGTKNVLTAPFDLAYFSDPTPRATSTRANWRIYSQRQNNWIAQVALPLDTHNITMRNYWWYGLMVAVALWFVSSFVTNQIISRILRPLNAILDRLRNLDAPSGETVPSTDLKGRMGDLARALQYGLQNLRENRNKEARFLATASHEIRTPVTALLADLEQTLGQPRSHQEMLAMAQRSHHTVTHLKNLTANLLALSRSETDLKARNTNNHNAQHQNTPPLPQVRCDLLTLALESGDRFAPLAARKGLQLLVDGTTAPLHGNPVLLAQTLDNLIHNAITYTSTGSVEVHVSNATNPTLTISDTGIGIPEDQLHKITEPYYRLETSNPGEHKGFGLGLAVVKNVVALHNGTWQIKSQPEHGTSITLVFPADAGGV